MNALMVSLLSEGLGESQTARRKHLQNAILEAGLEPKLWETARKWDGRELRLYTIRGGHSATLGVARRQAREKAQQQPWGVRIGQYSFRLEKREGEQLERALHATGIIYLRERGRGRPPSTVDPGQRQSRAS